MLALVVALTLSQCTKDTDCKGDRICSSGQCIDTQLVPSPLPPVSTVPVVENKPVSNPYRAHLWISMGAAIGLWAATTVGALAIGDQLLGTTVIPVFGPLASFLRCAGDSNCFFYPGAVPLIFLSTALQTGALAYLIASIVRVTTYEP